MGYFPNGTAGMDYEARYCNRCAHGPIARPDDGCAVWLAHMLKNYDECNNADSVLHILIPRTEGGIGNEQCTMFLEAR